MLNLGSAVVMPEVFLKALTVARNLHGGRPTGFTACDCDMQRHYRPRVNVVERPTQGPGGGRGVQLTGHHEILLPLLVWGVLARLDERRRGHRPPDDDPVQRQPSREDQAVSRFPLMVSRTLSAVLGLITRSTR